MGVRFRTAPRQDRDRYQRTRQQLAIRLPGMNDDAAAKSAVIVNITGRAERWPRGDGLDLTVDQRRRED